MCVYVCEGVKGGCVANSTSSFHSLISNPLQARRQRENSQFSLSFSLSLLDFQLPTVQVIRPDKPASLHGFYSTFKIPWIEYLQFIISHLCVCWTCKNTVHLPVISVTGPFTQFYVNQSFQKTVIYTYIFTVFYAIFFYLRGKELGWNRLHVRNLIAFCSNACFTYRNTKLNKMTLSGSQLSNILLSTSLYLQCS